METKMKCRVCEFDSEQDQPLCPSCSGLLRWFRSYFAQESREVLKRIDQDTRFVQDLGVDSLDYMCWPIEAQEKLGINIPNREMESLETVGQFLRCLRRHGASWPEDKDVHLVQEGGCWKRYVWEVIARVPKGEHG